MSYKLSRRKFISQSALTVGSAITLSHMGSDFLRTTAPKWRFCCGTLQESNFDAIVLGGGLAGFGCAVKLANAGLRVLLAEQRMSLCWECTWAHELDLRGIQSTIGKMLSKRLARAGGIRDEWADVAILEMTLCRIRRESGLQVLLSSSPLQLTIGKEGINGAWLGGKGTAYYVRADWWIDATENAIIWKLSGTPWELLKPAAVSRIFFNLLDDPIRKPIMPVEGMNVRGTVWDTEACLELSLPSTDPINARASIPNAVSNMREEVSALKHALVSHTSHETFPVGPGVRVETDEQRHPYLTNLVGAGVWCHNGGIGVDARFHTGERAASIVLKERSRNAIKHKSTSAPPLDFHRIIPGFDDQSYDVLVAGGGTGGAIAGLVSAREGVKTLVLEQGPVLGGVTTGAGIHYLCPGREGKILKELRDRHNSVVTVFSGPGRYESYTGGPYYHPEAQKLILQQLLVENGTEIRLSSSLFTAGITPGNAKRARVEYVGIATHHGPAVYQAAVFVDATGDGDLSRVAGATYRFGRDLDKRPYACTQAAATIYEGQLRWHNNDSGHVDPTDITDFTRARLEGIERYQLGEFSAENRILHFPPLLGIRQSLQIDGDYVLSFREQVSGHTFPDAVVSGYGRCGVHSRDFENDSEDMCLWVWGFGYYSRYFEFYIPYRCFVVATLDNVLLGSRCLSVEYDAFGPIRLQPSIYQIGETAGYAAAITAKGNGLVREIETGLLAEKLISTGTLTSIKWPIMTIPSDSEINLQTFKQAVAKTTQPETDLEFLKRAIWHAQILPRGWFMDLSTVMDDPYGYVRFLGGIAMLRYGDERSDDIFCELLEEQVEFKPDGDVTIPLWEAAIPFLRKVKNTDSLKFLSDLALNRTVNLSIRIASVHALGRSGLMSVADALRSLILQQDVVTRLYREYPRSQGLIPPPIFDESWALQLHAAHSLIKIGDKGKLVKETIGHWLKDPRAHVRRFARVISSEINSDG